MPDNKTHIIYTAEHIQQYFSGKLLPGEMHAMEKAALDDPFLAEAMEGYEGMQEQSWQQALAAAREKISVRGNSKKITPVLTVVRWWKAAAAVIIVAGGSGLVYFFNHTATRSSEPATIAAVKPAIADSPVAAHISSSPISADTARRVVVIKDKTAPLIAVVKPLRTTTNTTITKAFNQPADRESAYALSEPTQQQKENISMEPQPPAPVGDTAGNAGTAGYNRADAFAKKQTTANNTIRLSNRFSASVTAADNTPLPYANVLVVDENVGTYADAKGRFRLAAVDSILTVRVRAAGYMPQIFPIKSGVADNHIVLAPQQVASDDIVQLRNNKAPGFMPTLTVHLDSLTNVEPEDGWDNYDTYLSNNLSPTADKTIHGEVEVTFDVQKDGTVSNVSIAKSLCAACDQEVLRAVKEGPQWKVKNGKRDKGKVKVKF